MKNILLIAILFIFSCKKNRVVSTIVEKEGIEKYQKLMDSLGYNPPDILNNLGRNQRPMKQFYYKIAKTYVQYQNTKGLAFEVPIERLAMGGNSVNKSIWASFYYNVNMPDGSNQLRWVQFGYVVNKLYGLLPAFYVWNITPKYGQIATPINFLGNNNDIKYDSGLPIRFELKNKPGTTWWVFSRGGIEMLEVDLESDVAGGTNVATESYGADAFGTELHVSYYQVLQDEIWINVANGVIDGGGSWGIEGKNQIPTYNISEFRVGGRTPNTGGAYLWGNAFGN